MSYTRLGLYNTALRHRGEGTLVSLSEEQETRRILDGVWDDQVVRYCLGQGAWQFACRSVQMTYSASYDPPFGFKRAFPLPDDFVLLDMVSDNEYFIEPLKSFKEEAGVVLCDLDQIYVRYVSDDDDRGMDMGLWTPEFYDYLALEMAARAHRIHNSEEKTENLKKLAAKAKAVALGKEYRLTPAKKFPPGSFVNARVGRTGLNADPRRR